MHDNLNNYIITLTFFKFSVTHTCTYTHTQAHTLNSPFLTPTHTHTPMNIPCLQEFIVARDNLDRQRRVEMKKTLREKEQKERQRVKDKDAPTVEPKRS